MSPEGEHGLLFWIMGCPEGGRDRLLHHARRILDGHHRVRFGERLTVGHPRALGDRQVSSETFSTIARERGFALSWANPEGAVGVPSDIDDWLDGGCNVVLAGSRYAFERALARYEDALIAIFVRRHDQDHLIDEPRVREQTSVVRRRLIGTGPRLESPQFVTIQSDDDLHAAGDRLVKLLQGRRACA